MKGANIRQWGLNEKLYKMILKIHTHYWEQSNCYNLQCQLFVKVVGDINIFKIVGYFWVVEKLQLKKTLNVNQFQSIVDHLAQNSSVITEPVKLSKNILVIHFSIPNLERMTTLDLNLLMTLYHQPEYRIATFNNLELCFSINISIFEHITL